MADVLDVANALVQMVSASVQPFVGQTYIIPSAIDASTYGPQVVPPITVFAGTIILKDIMTRLEAGKSQIGVEFDETYASAPQYLTTDYFDQSNPPQPLVTATPSGSGGTTVTIGGSIQVGDVIGVAQGGTGAGYAVIAGDTLTSIATGLNAAMNAAGMAATVAGVVVVLTSKQPATFNVGASYTRFAEVWRRRKPFYVTLWSANMYDRQYIGRIIEASLAPGLRFLMPDNSVATLLYAGNDSFDSIDLDGQQRDMTYIRRSRCLIDFVTTQTILATQIVAPSDTITAQAPGTALTTTAPTVNQL